MAERGRVRVLHVSTGLEVGGSELMLARLVGRAAGAVEPVVVSLTGRGAVGERLAAAGTQVHALGMRSRLDARALARLVALVRAVRPDVVHCWMYHANLLGGLAARLAGVPRVVWGVRHTGLARGQLRQATRLVAALGARCSRHLPAVILFNAQASLRTHVAAGYDGARARVLPNGVDTAVFRPDAGARVAVRTALGVAEGAPLVGLVARWDPVKDHASFLAAAATVRAARPDARFVLVGAGVDPANAVLAAAIARAGLDRACLLLGQRDDVPRLTAALDVAVSSSITEAFPNVLAEALAAGVPCVAADCGDAGAIVGDAGRLVPPRDPAALAAGVLELLAAGAEIRARLGSAGRARVQARFSLEAAVAAHVALYEELTGASASRWRAS